MKHVFQFLCRLGFVLVVHLGARAEQPNILFIAVDDLRVELGCYGSAHVKSPNIDKLASQGTLFERAYCQQTVCNPSRASMLTGMRPDTLRIWDLPTHFRQHKPDAVTLPQLFKRSGYHAQCVGKIFHNWRQDDWKGDPTSWSVPSVLHYNSHSNDKPLVDVEVPPNLASGENGIECRDVPDNAYFDGRVAESAITALREAGQRDQPFFLAVGFWKPHTPFNAPKKYWDLYDRQDVPIPANITPPTDVPDIALTSARYRGGADSKLLREMHHGHLAAISYLDAQVGRVLDELDTLGLRKNTIIVFWSDHGLHLGEHGLTRKTTAFELDAHVPLIIAAPGQKPGQRTDALVELLDIYPTLANLCGLKAPAEVEGVPLTALLHDPAGNVKPVALTQTPRPNYLRGKQPKIMGYSIRTRRFRYTEWRDFKTAKAQATELYDHENDPLETVNVAGRPDHSKTIVELAKRLEQTLSGGNPSAVTVDTDDGRDDPLSILSLRGAGTNPEVIDYGALPVLQGEHAIINPVTPGPHATASDKIDMHHLRLNLHNYLVHYGGRFWCIWSDGPRIEDWPTQEIKYATSDDGLTWSDARSLTGTPDEPHAFIARGLWVRDGHLLALAAHYRGKGAFGAPDQKQLELLAYRYDDSQHTWLRHGKLYDNAINNFPPQELPSGEWILTRRDSRFNVTVLVGGRKAIDDWQAFPVVRVGEVKGFRPDEPIFWPLQDGQLFALFRDNGGSQRLFHSTSRDEGRSWDTPVLTNFPNSSSKLFSMKTSHGYRIIVLNANPSVGRRELHLAISGNGRTFTRLARLDVPSPTSLPDSVMRIEKKFQSGIASLQYPHVIEHDEQILIALSRGKVQTEVFRVRLDDVDALLEN
ncbi:MAG: sulfatase-like hydrolase/transferase [Fuerstiella sp.]|nr:sulfatase-like hydrolase/transferase [Fuerstiella sp.]MCP4856155.1 sulfatase-like hydrolase/transferase [Fuerstiella sp.]